ncbi:MAG TPA: TIM barrel protein [Verrucomicrobiota bacterium]|nr:TIM barrel protein [Verrucomicrobiota bacterium]
MKKPIKSESEFNRRKFIAINLSGIAGWLLLKGNAFAADSQKEDKDALVGSNIFGWGQYAQRDKRKLDVDEVIQALRDCGYDYLENFMDVNNPDNNAAFAEKLKSRGLKPVCLYTGARIHEAGKADEVVEKILSACKVCAKAGFKIISCNPDPIGRDKTDDELKTQAAALQKFGEGLKKLGMRLGIHNHMPEMANNARELRYDFQNTSPELVGLCYDVHWIWKGGMMPDEALKLFGNRIVSWHLRQSRNNIWWEDLDTGDIDYEKIAKYAKEHNLPRIYTVELAIEGGTKITRSVVENHRRSREFVRRVFGA